MSDKEYPYCVALEDGKTFADKWAWCSEHVQIGTWLAKYDRSENKKTSYYFKNEADAIAFKLIYS